MVKNEKFQCPSERGGPEDFKNHPTFVSSAFFGGVMASQTWEHFFWDTLYIYISSTEIRVALQYFNAVTLDILSTMEWMKEEGCQKGLT